MQNNLLQLFPLEKREFWKMVSDAQEQLQEIRLRANRPIIVIREGKEFFLDKDGDFTENPEEACQVTEKELEGFLNHICHYSPYAFEDEIRRGFITVAGGHRVGIAGQVVLERESAVRTMKHISYVNIRIAHQIMGVADKILPHLYEKGRIKNILIISPPECGKTTLLRDIIRQVSDGNVYGPGISVGVVDECSEIAGSYLGIPQNDVGIRTDVMDGCPKVLGMMLLLRSMAPGVIAIDELGGAEELEAVKQVSYCGSKIVATLHGMGLQDYIKKTHGNRTMEGIFQCVLILGKENGCPVVKKICGEEEIHAAFAGRYDDYGRLPGDGLVV